MQIQRRRRGVALCDVCAVIAAGALLSAILMPLLGAVGNQGKELRSLDNLRQLWTAHQTYAADWNGRQLTNMPDNLTEILDGDEYPSDYFLYDEVSPIGYGHNCKGQFYESNGSSFVQAFHGGPSNSIGYFRTWAMVPFTQYVNGKVYDPLFWAPKDFVLLDNPEITEYINLPCEWPGNVPYWFPSYCLAVSAQYSPDVWARDSIGQQSPRDLEFGHRSPTFDQARYPDLKTFKLEHYWLQNAPKDPYIPGSGGVPYFFNLGLDSVPATLFYDGSVRFMAHTEAIMSDELVQMTGQDSLVASSDPEHFGSDLYFEPYSYMDEDVSSYHIFTADGILGRDTLFAAIDAGQRVDPE